MKPVLTPVEMADADRAAIASGVPSMLLMTRAGAACGRAAVRMMGGCYGRRVLVACGKGNNGGDGFVLAAWLARRGAVCTVAMMAEPSQLAGDALAAYQDVTRVPGCRFTPWERVDVERHDLVADALLGTGFKGALSGRYADVVSALNSAGKPVLAVDIPSGVDGETGAVGGVAVRAARTVTMGALKSGLLLHPGAGHAGSVEVADIGIAIPEGKVQLVSPADAAAVLPPRSATSHKRSTGKVLVVAGSQGMAGAAVLTALGALRTGAGLVRLAVPESIAGRAGAQIKECLTAGLPESGGRLDGRAAGPALELAQEMDAVAIGPGLGRGDATTAFVRAVMEGTGKPVVCDADGLFAYAGDASALQRRAGPTVVTPHSGELGRLLGMPPAEVDAARLGIARQAAAAAGSVVLLKGYRTVVAAPGFRAPFMVDAGGPVLATAGTGDVLTGVIAALLAGNVEPFAAAWAGACLHGAAGERLARTIGERGVLAGEVAGALPATIAGLR